MKDSKLEVGDLVVVRMPCLGNPAHAPALVVEVYELSRRPGYGLLFPNGAYDGFSPKDLHLWGVSFRASLGPPFSRYKFTNVMRLTKDFRAGMFDRAFHPEKEPEQS